MYAKTKQENKRGKSISLYCAATFAAFLTLLSCTGNSDKDEMPEGKLAISIEPSSLALTKAGTSFDEWDMIGLSVVGWLDGKEQDLTGIRNEDNVCYMCSSGPFSRILHLHIIRTELPSVPSILIIRTRARDSRKIRTISLWK